MVCIRSGSRKTLIYPVVVSSAWGGGWLTSALADVFFVDFAGSGIVHFTGGVGALVDDIVAGPRVRRWTGPAVVNC